MVYRILWCNNDVRGLIPIALKTTRYSKCIFERYMDILTDHRRHTLPCKAEGQNMKQRRAEVRTVSTGDY